MGGVGRSMALANIADLLARWDQRVLLVDMDWRNPGIENFFKDYCVTAGVSTGGGTLDIIAGAWKEEKGDSVWQYARWQDYLYRLSLDEGKVSFDLLTAGRHDDLSGFFATAREHGNLERHFAVREGGALFESWREEWAANYDYVLIDCPSGVTDIGGVAVVQMADVLLLFFGPNRLQIERASETVVRAQAERQKLAYDRSSLTVIPVLSRVDNRERAAKEEYQRLAAAYLAPHLSPLVSPGRDAEQLVSRLMLQSHSYYSFGQMLSVEEDSVADTTTLAHPYAALTALLVLNFSEMEIFFSSLSSYVRTASRAKQSTDN